MHYITNSGNNVFIRILLLKFKFQFDNIYIKILIYTAILHIIVHFLYHHPLSCLLFSILTSYFFINFLHIILTVQILLSSILKC